jgi:copper chaperone CopZ
MAAERAKNREMGIAAGNDCFGHNYFSNMRFEYSIKTDCLACLGIVKEVIKKIDGVKEAELDLKTGKIIIDYGGKLSREELAGIIKEKTGYNLE